ncbi:uncharacterized protein LOC116207909 isoform X2 [Punica granatum]|uniref:Uncharacterized protein LOC116207909 isoform X2 n=1 Tax=Punica granatum TaxID=22663 RepID=A0A6P8DR71_PUNGR|nr:uncharacterized protein LOC116207909 isoform X2 [Punica granatum]
MYLRASVSDVLRRRIRFPPGTATGTITATATATSSSVTAAASTNLAPLPPPLPPNVRNSCSGRGFTWRKSSGDVSLWFMLYAQAGTCSDPVFAEGNSVESSSLTDPEDAEVAGLRRVDDDAVISNEHTMKWRIFTDNGRDSFQKGKLSDAEKFFLSALREAKEGFGERDAHVASACNNLAELYRVMKAFDKAEPLQLEAINILEDSFGPEDIRVGVAFHNLGQLYLVQRKLEDACSCYQRALKIKGRVLGHSHPDYADTMYHLGKVLHLQGKEKESEALIVDSIRILEEGGHGQSNLYMRRLRHLAQLYLKSSRPVDAENVQRKILHALELVKGWDSLDTVMAAEGLALTLQSAGKLREAHELLERCLDARKKLLPEYHIQTGANMLHLARVAMLYSNQLRSRSASDATIQLEKAKDFLENCIRISQQVLIKLMKQKTLFRKEDSAESRRNARIAMIILMQALDALGLLEINRMELQDSRDSSGAAGAENALLRCIDAYKEFERESSISDSVEVRTEYLKCLKHLLSLLTDGAQGRRHSRKVTVKELKDEINHVESEVSASRGHGKKA